MLYTSKPFEAVQFTGNRQQILDFLAEAERVTGRKYTYIEMHNEFTFHNAHPNYASWLCVGDYITIDEGLVGCIPLLKFELNYIPYNGGLKC